MTYFIIFILKIFENALATLRLILVSNGKKLLGSILLLSTSIVWLASSSIAITNINLIMIVVFAGGSLVGSYIGSLIEEKLALGNNLVMCVSSKDIDNELRISGYIVTKLIGQGMNGNKNILLIVIKRKKNKELIKFISSLDSKAIIISEYANILS